MSRSTGVPLWTARLAALAMACAWSVIAFSVAINALVKSNHQKDHVRAIAPPGARVDIDDLDIFRPGAVITAVCIAIFVVTSFYIAILFVGPASKPSRAIALQGGILAFFATWLFAALVPYTHFFRTHSAIISLGGQPLSESMVQSLGAAFGLSPVYKNLGYLRLVAILPWITLLFTLIASVILFMAASRTSKKQPLAQPARASRDAPPSEKVESPDTESPSVPNV